MMGYAKNKEGPTLSLLMAPSIQAVKLNLLSSLPLLRLNVLTEWRLYGDSVQRGLSERLPLYTHAVRSYLVC